MTQAQLIPTAPTIDQIIERYLSVRNQKAELVKQQKADVAVLDETLEKIENYLLAVMNRDGTTSLKTTQGTAFKALQHSVSINDPESFKGFVLSPVVDSFAEYLLSSAQIELEPEDLAQLKIILMESGRWQVSELKASKTGVKEYIEEKQEPVPGVTVNQVTVVNVRKA